MLRQCSNELRADRIQEDWGTHPELSGPYLWLIILHRVRAGVLPLRLVSGHLP